MYDIERLEVIFQLHILVGVSTCDKHNHVLHDLLHRDLERKRVPYVRFSGRTGATEVDLGQHFELVPLPEDGTVVSFSTKSH